MPGQAGRADHGEGEKRIQAHARRHADREVRRERHDQRSQRGGQAGGDEHRAGVHAGGREDLRIDEDDVGHRQEGGGAGQQLGADGGAVRAQAEQAIDGHGGGLFIRGRVPQAGARAAWSVRQAAKKARAGFAGIRPSGSLPVANGSPLSRG